MKNIIFLATMLLLHSFAVAQSPKKVAVYVIGEDVGINKVLESKLVTALSFSGKYTAVERTSAFLAEINKEQKYQRNGSVDDNEISRLGRQFGVKYVCVADVSDILGEKYVSARLIDVETAEVANSYGVGGEMNNMNDCLRMANEIATNLSKGTFAEQAETDRKERLAEIQRHYINLGLPSGTLWKDENETGGFYTYEEAIIKWRSDLPSKEQFQELIDKCRWEWEGRGYKITGSNGNSIFLPAAGFDNCGEYVHGVEEECYYLSSTRHGSNRAYYLCSDSEDIYMNHCSLCLGLPVRLVQNK